MKADTIRDIGRMLPASELSPIVTMGAWARNQKSKNRPLLTEAEQRAEMRKLNRRVFAITYNGQ